MPFIRITNAGTLPRVYLETIGLSAKRDRTNDDELIGLFGTGFKFAAVAGFRLGIGTAVASSDEDGRYFVRIGSEPIAKLRGRAAQRLTYRYYALADGVARHDYDYASSLALEACLDFDLPIGDDDAPPYKLLREHVCNARDEDKAFTVTTCDEETFAAPGTTAVYLTDSPELRRILANPARYFKFLLKPPPLRRLAGVGAIWPKSERGMTRLFIRGVNVEATAAKERASLFDYDSVDKTLQTNDRILKNPYGFKEDVCALLCAEKDPAVTAHVLRGIRAGAAPYEAEALGHAQERHFSDKSRAAWLKAVCDAYGPRPCIASGTPNVDDDARHLSGYDLVTEASREFKHFLAQLGIPHAREVLPNLQQSVEGLDFDDLDPESQTRFSEAFDRFSRRYPDRAHIPISFGIPLTEAAAQHGFAINWERILLLTQADGTLPCADQLYMTLEHESCHCVTRAGDSDRAFRLQADLDLLDDMLLHDGVPVRDDGTSVPQLAKRGTAPCLVPFEGVTRDD